MKKLLCDPVAIIANRTLVNGIEVQSPVSSIEDKFDQLRRISDVLLFFFKAIEEYLCLLLFDAVC